MAINSAAAVAKLRSLTNKFDQRVKATTPFYPRLCSIITSTGADEEHGLLGSVPGVHEWLGDRQFNDLSAASYTIVNKHWESSIRVRKTHIEDDRMGIYDTMYENLARRAARHPDKLLISNLMVNGTSQTCLDGQFFFDTDHSWGDSGSQSNDLTASAAAPAAPTIDEFKAALSAAIQAMLAYKDDNGELIHDDAVFTTDGDMELMIMVPLHLQEVATKATTAGIMINNGETNVPVVTAEVASSAHLTGNFFDLYRTDTPIKPFIFQARKPLERRTKGLDDIEFNDVKFMTEARYNIGYGGWWNAVRTTFS